MSYLKRAARSALCTGDTKPSSCAFYFTSASQNKTLHAKRELFTCTIPAGLLSRAAPKAIGHFHRSCAHSACQTCPKTTPQPHSSPHLTSPHRKEPKKHPPAPFLTALQGCAELVPCAAAELAVAVPSALTCLAVSGRKVARLTRALLQEILEGCRAPNHLADTSLHDSGLRGQGSQRSCMPEVEEQHKTQPPPKHFERGAELLGKTWKIMENKTIKTWKIILVLAPALLPCCSVELLPRCFSCLASCYSFKACLHAADCNP